MTCKTILAAGAALVCTNALLADGVTKALNNETKYNAKAFSAKIPTDRSRSLGGYVKHSEVGGNVGGEDAGSAVVIPALPFTDQGNSSLFLDDSNETCPYTLTGAPDTYYVFSAASTQSATVSFCSTFTTFDTKTYVYENAVTPGAPVGCNDDSCVGGLGAPFVSFIPSVTLVGGNDYYFVQDGWSSVDAGNYQIDIFGAVPCVVSCQSGDVLGDTSCGYTVIGSSTFEDADNDGGCNSPVPEFASMNCGEVFCSTTWLNGSLGLRDTDWIEVVFTESNDVAVSMICDNDISGYQLGVFDGNAGCPLTGGQILATITTFFGCQTIAIVGGPVLGNIWIFASTFGLTGECSTQFNYRIGLECECGPYLLGDIDGDGEVNFNDLNIVLTQWEADCGQ